MHIGHPERLRDTKAALYRAAIGARRVPALPADPFGADTPLLAPHRARIDAVAQRERIDAEPFGQLVDRLL